MPPAARHPGRELTAAQVRRRCDPATLSLTALPADGADLALIGQDRALSALQLGVTLREKGFNLYVAGPPGLGKMTAVLRFLDRAARSQPTPDDWCYVHNFDDPVRPRVHRRVDDQLLALANALVNFDGGGKGRRRGQASPNGKAGTPAARR